MAETLLFLEQLAAGVCTEMALTCGKASQSVMLTPSAPLIRTSASS
jgi:hypothetical protein